MDYLSVNQRLLVWIGVRMVNNDIATVVAMCPIENSIVQPMTCRRAKRRGSEVRLLNDLEMRPILNEDVRSAVEVLMLIERVCVGFVSKFGPTSVVGDAVHVTVVRYA